MGGYPERLTTEDAEDTEGKKREEGKRKREK
jgi:hypothetical protein